MTTFSPAAKLLQQQQQQPIDAPTSRADVITDVTVTRQPIARPRHSARAGRPGDEFNTIGMRFVRPAFRPRAGRSVARRARTVLRSTRRCDTSFLRGPHGRSLASGRPRLSLLVICTAAMFLFGSGRCFFYPRGRKSAASNIPRRCPPAFDERIASVIES